MKKLYTITILAMTLSACGGDEASSGLSKSKTDPIKLVASSKLSKFMQQTTVCNVISKESIQKTFGMTLEINAESSGYTSKYSNSVTCNYSWDRADAAERKEKYMSYVMDQMQGKVDKIPMRQRTLSQNFSVRLEEYKGQVQNFIPVKLTEEQLQKQIASAKKRAAERLTDEQKRIAGDMANSMMERMLRKNNEFIKIDGVGDAAFWTAVTGGGLNVLSGNIKMSISPMIADTLKEDIENASKIANLIIQ